MPDLEPITREEMLLDGQDLEPITRKEMFIKRIYDKTQFIPKPITREEMFLKKAGEGGSDVNIKQLSVTENGTYSEEGTAYSPVIVNVPAPPIPDNAYLLNDLSGLPADIASFSDGSNLPMPSLKVGIEPIQSGSGDPSPSNIRPISGFTEGNVSVVGDATKVQFFQGLLNGTYGVVDLGSIDWFVGGTYNNIFYAALSEAKKPLNDSTSANIICVPYETKAYNDINVNDSTTKGIAIRSADLTPTVRVKDATYSTVQAFKTAMSGVYLIYELATPTTPTITPTEFNNLLSEFGIDGHLYNISWEDEVGTVYGGTLDVVSGVLDENQFCYKVTSDTNITKSGNYFEINNVLPEDATANYQFKASFCKRTETSLAYMVDGEGRFVTDRRYLAVKLPYSTVEDVKTYLTSIDAQIVYTLPTPTTYQLSPTAVFSLLGENNVWADCGQILEGEYFSKEA